MKKSSMLLWISMIAGLLLLNACAFTPPQGYDYATYMANMPRSILVLPPRNETTEVMAPYVYISTVTRILAERGYYVFPVAVVDALMKENGVPTPEEMAQIPLKKLQEVIHPDAVLYLTIAEWGAKYQLVDTSIIVHIRGKLVDTDTGVLLWEGEHTVRQNSNANANKGIVEMMVSAIAEKIVSSIVDPTRDLAYRANEELFYDKHKGLLIGWRHQDFAEDQQRLRQTQ